MPSFAIEAPGEANPLTENTLLHTLQAASSRDSQQVQSGTKQLQQWERASEYYQHLQSVFITTSLPVEIRYLAIIQLKNGIDKYWRKTATNAVSQADKSVIRSRLITSGIDEQDQRLALQNALVVAKVARFEYPTEWPDVIGTVIERIRTSSHEQNSVRLSRGLLILLNVVKELASGRLLKSRQNLQAATPEILSVLGGIYVEKVRQWQSALESSAHAINVEQTMSESLLSIKILRRLLIAGYDFPNRQSEVHEFWNLTFGQVDSYISLLDKQSQLSLSPERVLMVEKHLLQLSKLHLEMAKTHPAAFVLLPNSLNLVKAYWGLIKQFAESFGSKQAVIRENEETNRGDTNDKTVLEKLSLKGLLLIRACIKMVFSPTQTFRYRHAQEKEEKKQAESTVRQDLLSQDFVGELMNVTVTKFFVLRQGDLNEWNDDPEDWEGKEENESEGFEFSIRPCAEKLFLDVAINYKDLLAQPLLEVFASVANLQNEDVLFKDSVYSAIGLSAAVLFQKLDFDHFLVSTLAAEAQKQQPGYNILRRRIAILIGQWITIKISKPNRPLVYEIFQHMLNPYDPLNDLVVRVSAGRQFKHVADEWEFDATQFMPYAETTMTRIMKLIEEVESTETKMALLNTISVLVERLEHHVAPYANSIVEMLPTLWEQSGEEHLMKQAILTILTRLVTSLKAQAAPLQPIVIPIIQGAVEPGSETALYLLEDALDLWHALLTQSESPISADLLALVPYLFTIFELGSESLRKALEITESYVLLAPRDILADDVRKPLFTSFASLLSTVNPDASGILHNTLEVIIRSAESIGQSEAIQQITSDLVSSGFLPTQLSGLHSAWEAHCSTGPLASEPSVDGVVETDYFSVLARITLASPSILLTALTHSVPSAPLDATLKWLMEEWFNHLENIGDVARRKLMALALTKLLETSHPVVLGNLQLLMSMWTDVVTGLREDANGEVLGTLHDNLVYENADQLKLVEEGAVEAPEDVRRRVLSFEDPVHRISLPEFVRAYLGGAVQSCGGEEAFQNEWMVNVDREVVGAFGKLGIM